LSATGFMTDCADIFKLLACLACTTCCTYLQPRVKGTTCFISDQFKICI
jgi:hypothetical protein